MHADAEHATIPLEKLNEDPWEGVTPVTRAIAAQDQEGLSATFRDFGPSDTSIAAKLSRQTAAFRSEAHFEALFGTLKNAALPSEAFELTDNIVNQLLKDIAQSLPSKQRTWLLRENVTQAELVQALRYASRTQRLDFFGKLLCIASSSDEVREFVSGKLDNAMHYLAFDEKQQLVTELAEGLPETTSQDFLAKLFGSVRDLKELRTLVEQIGIDSLLATQRSEIKEFVAHAVIGNEIGNISFGDSIPVNASYADIADGMFELDLKLQRTIALCTKDARLSDTHVAKGHVHTAEYNRKLLLDKFRDNPSNEQLRDFANLVSFKAGIEFEYGLLLSNEPDSWGYSGAKWSLSELHDVRAALGQMPKNTILFTPLLREIERTRTIKGRSTYLGARWSSGIIRIADGAINNGLLSFQYMGLSSLQLVLVHEMGHSIQLGSNFGHAHFDHNGDYTITTGDAMYEFIDYLAIADWHAIEPQDWELVRKKKAPSKVKIDGTEYPLEQAVTYEGEQRVFTLYAGTLYSYRADAEFSSDSYSRTSPWEDWAEAFSEYILAPLVLLQHAPQKFWTLECEFHKYENDPQVRSSAARKRNTKEALTKLSWII